MLAPRPARADARAMKPGRGAPRLDDERRETTGPATTPRAFSEVRKTGDSAELVMPPHRSGPNHRLGLGWWAVVVVQSAGVLHGAIPATPRSARRVTRNDQPSHHLKNLLVGEEEGGGVSSTACPSGCEGHETWSWSTLSGRRVTSNDWPGHDLKEPSRR